jgi:undecaprenyl-diphosphatase
VDFTLFRDLNGLAYHHDRFEDFLRFFTVNAELMFVTLLAVLFFARGKWASRNARHGVVAAGLAAALALGVAQVITHIWERPRPFIAHPGVAHLFVSHAADPSFPSDHATAAFAIAVSLLLRSRRVGLLALAMAVVVAVGRVAVGVHYPSDVIGGALLGTAAALLLWIPPIRGPLGELADWASGIYEKIVSVFPRRPATSPPG